LHPIVLNKTCRYGPGCDPILVHQDELEHQLAAQFSELDPSVIGKDYLVLGTVDRQDWREGVTQPKGIAEMLDHLHQFKEVQSVRVQPGGWYRDDMDPSELPILEPRPLDTAWRKQARPPDDRPDRSREGKRRQRKKRRRR